MKTNEESARATRKEVYFIRFIVEFLEELRRISLDFNFCTDLVSLYRMQEFTHEISFRWFRDVLIRIVVQVYRHYHTTALAPPLFCSHYSYSHPFTIDSSFAASAAPVGNEQFPFRSLGNLCITGYEITAGTQAFATTLSRAPKENARVLLSISLFLLTFQSTLIIFTTIFTILGPLKIYRRSWICEASIL